MNTHTKATWRVEESDTLQSKPTRRIYAVIDGKREILFTTHYPDTYTGSNGGSEREANARLACAAPAMLKALLVAQKAIAGMGTADQLKQIATAIEQATSDTKHKHVEISDYPGL
jgi:hypothetical protein